MCEYVCMSVRLYVYMSVYLCVSSSVGYSDSDLVLDWMNATEPDVPSIDPAARTIIIDDQVVLPQFEIKGATANYCTRQYHQKVGQCLNIGCAFRK